MPTPIIDPHKTDFKVGDMVFLKNHTLTTAFDINTRLVIESVNDYLTKHFDM